MIEHMHQIHIGYSYYELITLTDSIWAIEFGEAVN